MHRRRDRKRRDRSNQGLQGVLLNQRLHEKRHQIVVEIVVEVVDEVDVEEYDQYWLDVSDIDQ